MPFEHDVFISYPHLSNQDDQFGHNGWVAKFHARLKLRLGDLLGREARIWRDNKLPVGAVFDEAISKRLRETKVLLCILSPAYVQSDWCLRELREFRDAAPQTGGLSVNDQSRIITAVKTYLPDKQHPPELRNSLYCEFYERTEDRGGMPRDLSQEPGGYRHEDYELKVDEIAWAIKQVVEQLGDDEERLDAKRTIYLAETTRDRVEDRDKIKSELEAREFIVLPSGPLPKDTAQEYAAAVRENLRRSFMSIHLMGRSQGLIPEEGEGKSVVQIQNELAAQFSSDDELFTRIIWIPKNLENPEPLQVTFLNHLRESEEALCGAHLIERSFEDLKSSIILKITKEQPAPPPDNLIRIYLICDKLDDDSVDPVGNFLFGKGYEVIPPPEADEEGQAIKYHKNSLLRCDAALTIYGNAKFEWVQDRHDDVVQKVKGWGRKNNIACRAILRTDPENRYKNRLFLQSVKLLPPCYHGLSDAALAESLGVFITELEQTIHQ
jgi:hypothetical protein